VKSPTSATRLIALLGNPVSHSVSPVFQNAAFAAAGVDGVYVALRCDAAAVPGLIAGIAGAGGGGNVTVPHKEVAAASVQRRTEAVERTGACNTYWSEAGVVWGDNTDVAGSALAIRALLGGAPTGARVLLLGAGGAARAALAALADEGADEVVLVNRTPERAAALVERFRGAALRLGVAGAGETPAGGFDLAINATSLGLHAEDPLPLGPEWTGRVGAGFDMAYRRGGTAWVRSLRDAGVPASDGREMLLWQGVAAFERWWPVPAPVEAMRAALDASVGGGAAGE
jgi:shikimate dehydrogenase